MSNVNERWINIYDADLLAVANQYGFIFRGDSVWNFGLGEWEPAFSTTLTGAHRATGVEFPATNALGVTFELKSTNVIPIGLYDFVYTDSGTTFIGGVKIRITNDGIIIVPE